jgi:hypothetical protein
MTYRAYGRTIASDRPLPELETADAIADLTITWDGRAHFADGGRWTTLWRFSTEEPWVTTARVNGVRHLRFGRFADVALSPRRIEVSRRGHASDVTLRHLVLDQALPLALASEGALVVHASAVASGHRASVLAGRAGAGKSTLAALLAREGMRVIADDGVVLEGRAPDVRVVASYPGLRVYRDSAEAAGLDVTRTADVAEYSRKVRIIPPRASYDSQPESLTLAAMYSLAPGESAVRLERLTRRDAAMAVLEHAYRIDPGDRSGLEAQMDAVATVAPDVWRVSYPRDLERAAAVASAVAAHARGLGL